MTQSLEELPGSWVGASFETVGLTRRTWLGATSVLDERTTAFQHLVVAEVPGYGTTLFLDGTVQLAASDEAVYHERLALVPVLAHPRPAKVLILGGGDGCAAREVLRIPDVEEVTVVDIDPEVVASSRVHLRHLNRGSLDDPRVRVFGVDARQFLTAERLAEVDVVIVDFLDAYSEDELQLYDEVLRGLATHVGRNTLISLHGDLGQPGIWPGWRVYALAARYFSRVEIHSAYLESYTGDWGFILAGQDPDWVLRLASAALTQRAQVLTEPPDTLGLAGFIARLGLSPAQQRLIGRVSEDPLKLPADLASESRWIDLRA
ncbi:MAG TPA: hypothetical protein PLC98_00100 [Anaerolineales bacterium]|nr:hypothetical protein [Anaerolineales bacterium]